MTTRCCSPANPSTDPARDVLSGPGRCAAGKPLAGYLDRCGPGPRQPLLVISPYAKPNSVDHTLSTQVSITRFIEDNGLGGNGSTADRSTRPQGA